MTKTIKGSIVLITGANGAIAQALIAALKTRGAAKIYAAARDISGIAASDRVVPLKMDVSSDDDVKKAAAAAPKEYRPHFLLGSAYNHMERFREAVAEFEIALRLGSNDAEVYYQAARAYGKLDRQDDRRQALARFSEPLPTNNLHRRPPGLTLAASNSFPLARITRNF